MEARILVSIATYNERDNVGPLTREILAVVPAADILVIDDNSPDGTGKAADDLAAADSRIHVLHRPGKLGLGKLSQTIHPYPTHMEALKKTGDAFYRTKLTPWVKWLLRLWWRWIG